MGLIAFAKFNSKIKDGTTSERSRVSVGEEG